MNIVCADFVTNGSLAIAWHTFNEYGRTQFEPKIYHINRVSDPALIFGEFFHSSHAIQSFSRSEDIKWPADLDLDLTNVHICDSSMFSRVKRCCSRNLHAVDCIVLYRYSFR